MINYFIKCKFVECSSKKMYFNDYQECKVRPQIVNVNSDEPIFYPFSIKTSKRSGSCNNINDPYANMCVLDVAVLNIMLK